MRITYENMIIIEHPIIIITIIAGSLGILGAAAVFVELQKKWNNR